MPWFLRSIKDHDTHRGVLSRGSVIATCGLRFEPVRITFGRVALSGLPHDPRQICPTCQLVEDTR